MGQCHERADPEGEVGEGRRGSATSGRAGRSRGARGEEVGEGRGRGGRRAAWPPGGGGGGGATRVPLGEVGLRDGGDAALLVRFEGTREREYSKERCGAISFLYSNLSPI